MTLGANQMIFETHIPTEDFALAVGGLLSRERHAEIAEHLAGCTCCAWVMLRSAEIAEAGKTSARSLDVGGRRYWLMPHPEVEGRFALVIEQGDSPLSDLIDAESVTVFRAGSRHRFRHAAAAAGQDAQLIGIRAEGAGEAAPERGGSTPLRLEAKLDSSDGETCQLLTDDRGQIWVELGEGG